jgi:hypothetical protein
LVKSLVELVYVDLETKQVTAIKPTPAFRAMFGKGIDVGKNAPIELHTPDMKSKDTVGVGGDGGGLTSHNSNLLLKSSNLPSDIIYVRWLLPSINHTLRPLATLQQITNIFPRHDSIKIIRSDANLVGAMK